ncbi:MAG: FemAB family XrtA/PEP-CTERM system-associated protein [Myxococcota bacterium]
MSTFVEQIKDADASRWDGYVLEHPHATSYHLYGWRACLGEGLRHTSIYLRARRAGKWVGVLPLVHLHRPLLGDLLVSLPFVNYGGILADDPSAAQALEDEAIRLARRLAVTELELRQTSAEMVTTLPASTHRVTLRLRLPSDEQALWKLMGTKLRNQARKAEKTGLRLQAHGMAGLDPFYQVFSQNMRDLGSPVWPRRFFERILYQFPERARLFVLSLQHFPAAAGFVFQFKQTLEIPWASALRSFNPVCANVGLYHGILSHAVREGYEQFDFGRSAPDSGTWKFKKQWGAEESPLHWHRWQARANQNQSSGISPQLGKRPEAQATSTEGPSTHGRASSDGGLEARREQLEQAWQKLPVWATRLVGPPLRRLLAQ